MTQKSISVPPGTTEIENYAFEGCSNLESIIIPEGVTTIGYDAFKGCTSLKSVILPQSLKEICGGAFQECTGLVSITLPPNTEEIGFYAFYGCTALESITIPRSVNTIEEAAFSECSNLKKVIINEGTTIIEKSAFSGCSSLESITIPEGVTTIGEDAFSYCTNLKSIRLPKSLTKIQGIIFDDCTGIESIVVDEGNKVYDSRNGCNAIIETASGMLLAACSNAVIPEGVTGVGLGAFDYAENLKSIAIPKGVTRFESFPNNRVLESIVVEEGNSVYDSRGGCNAIIETATDILIAGCASTIIPQGIKAIGRGAFDGSKKLNEITIPDSVADIGRYHPC